MPKLISPDQAGRILRDAHLVLLEGEVGDVEIKDEEHWINGNPVSLAIESFEGTALFSTRHNRTIEVDENKMYLRDINGNVFVVEVMEKANLEN